MNSYTVFFTTIRTDGTSNTTTLARYADLDEARDHVSAVNEYEHEGFAYWA